MSLLPPVPEGENPWTVYEAALRSMLYKSPSPGFRARLIGEGLLRRCCGVADLSRAVLLSVNGACMLLAAIYLICIIVDAREKGSIRKGLWTFRMASRKTGSYVITNAKLFCVIFT